MFIDMLKSIKEFEWNLRGYLAFFILSFSIIGFFLTAMTFVVLIVSALT